MNLAVGIGPPRKQLAHRAAARLSFEIDEGDIAEIAEQIFGQ